MRLPHLYLADEKLSVGETVTALCKKQVVDVRFDFTAGGDIQGRYVPSGDYCPNCEIVYKAAAANEPKPYLYGIFPAKWIRNKSTDV